MNRNNFLKAIGAATGLSLLLPKKSEATYVPVNNNNGSILARPTINAKMGIFGDSITSTTLDSHTNWPSLLTPMQLASINNFAKSGGTWKDEANPVNVQQWCSNQIASAISSGVNFDILVFAHGTNDFDLTKLGSYATAMGKATLNDLDRTLFFEAMRWNLWTANNQWSSAKIFVCTPLQRADGSMSFMDTLNPAIKQMANRYCATVIDAWSESGIIAENEVVAVRRYTTDGLHPNSTGKQLQANYMINKISTAMTR